MSEFKPLNLKTYNNAVAIKTPDEICWKKLSVPVIVKQFTEVNYVHASSVNPSLAAVSSGPKVVIYNTRSGRPVSTITRFQRTAYGASYRDDGKLLVAGSEDATVRLFDCRNDNQLRIFKGHKGPVRRVKFMPDFPPRIVSFSDDKSVIIWDISDEKQIAQLNGHTDFIRAGCVNTWSPHLVASGSEDRTVKVWDVRTGSAVFNMDHGTNHVNDVLCLHGGNMIATAAGCEVRVWDLAGGKMLCKVCRHHKDVTSLGLATGGTRLVSGSLDQHLKFYDVTTYNVVHSISCAASILSFAVMPEDSGLVVGMFSEGKGLISLQKIATTVKPETKRTKQTKEIETQSVKVIKQDKISQLSFIDKLLKGFAYSRLLVFSLGVSQPADTIAIMAELLRRDVLHQALAGNDEGFRNRIFNFIYKHFANSTFQPVLVEVIHCLLDVYGKDMTTQYHHVNHINKLQALVANTMKHTEETIMLAGIMKMMQTESSSIDS